MHCNYWSHVLWGLLATASELAAAITEPTAQLEIPHDTAKTQTSQRNTQPVL